MAVSAELLNFPQDNPYEGMTQANFMAYNEALSEQSADLRLRFAGQLAGAGLPHEVGMARRQTVNSEAFRFLRDEGMAFRDRLGPDFRPHQVIFLDKLLRVNREHYYSTLSQSRQAGRIMLESVLTHRYPVRAVANQRRFPEIAFGRRLREQFYAHPDMPNDPDTDLQAKAVLDCLTIYGQTIFAVREQPGSHHLPIWPPHVVRDSDIE